jgi:hypothetical protein
MDRDFYVGNVTFTTVNGLQPDTQYTFAVAAMAENQVRGLGIFSMVVLSAMAQSRWGPRRLACGLCWPSSGGCVTVDDFASVAYHQEVTGQVNVFRRESIRRDPGPVGISSYGGCGV